MYNPFLIMAYPTQNLTTASSEIGYRMELEKILREKIAEVDHALNEPSLSRFMRHSLWLTNQGLRFQQSMNDHHLHLVLNALNPCSTILNETWSESEIEVVNEDEIEIEDQDEDFESLPEIDDDDTLDVD